MFWTILLLALCAFVFIGLCGAFCIDGKFSPVMAIITAVLVGVVAFGAREDVIYLLNLFPPLTTP
ncbi:hypothetical protein [Photobacterium rosenbergii]|uniref:hypothetical protein n=1 Tax=Photobacterium rosenbergii TaxID=294936 RepID=UPI001C9A1658|nr:hypothetical protein [Photobacterium rosenbergii]MBY5948783.1 hypothetical protein [Photobacterium rosenbergii]